MQGMILGGWVILVLNVWPYFTLQCPLNAPLTSFGRAAA